MYVQSLTQLRTTSPSQSSYFAGKPFSVTITFTNTRSPGTPRSAITQSVLKTPAVADVPRRKGLIGKKKPPSLPLQSAGELPDMIEQRRRRQLAPKALSVSVLHLELENEVGEGVIASSALYTQRSFFRDTLHSELYIQSSRLQSDLL